jgi:hypothetical protein
MLRQAQHERKSLILLEPFALSLSKCEVFPLEIALFRTFAVPAISALLDRTGEFHQRPQRRYDDTDLLVSALLEEGYDGELGRKALRNMNRQHGRFDIANDEFLYASSGRKPPACMVHSR